MAKFYIKSLDGLRGLAVILVFLFHFGRLSFISLGFEAGWIGVQLFFVLSGYLITRILLEQKEVGLSTYLKKFYWRRGLRIFPLYFGYLVILTALFLFIAIPENFSSIAIYLFSYTYNFSVLSIGPQVNRLFTHLWSLCVEEQFYIVWPFIIYFLSVRQTKILIVSLLFFSPTVRFILFEFLVNNGKDNETIGTSIYWFPLSHFDAFAIGGGVNFVKERLLGLRAAKWIIFLLLISLIAGALNYFTLMKGNLVSASSFGYSIHETRNLQFIWSYSILNFLFASIIWYLTSSTNQFFSWTPLVSLGRISYGIYLFHFPIMGILTKVYPKAIINEWITLMIYFLITVVAAWGSYIFYETRFLRLKSE